MNATNGGDGVAADDNNAVDDNNAADDNNVAGANDIEDNNTGDTPTGQLEAEESSTTRVNFDITVPAYVSNALQVRVVWGRYYRGVEP